MKRRTQLKVLALSLLASACGTDRILHDGDDGADASATTTGGEERGGNFPEPALTVCGALPDGVVAIEGLASAYALTGPRNGSGNVGSPDALRIRLVSWGLEPTATLPGFGSQEQECGESGWGFAFDLPAEHRSVGVHELVDVVPSYPEWHYHHVTINDATCSEGGDIGGDDGDDVPLDMVGQLEIFAVTDTCVVGELRAMDTGMSHDVIRNGGFVAQRLAVPCVPSGSATCE